MLAMVTFMVSVPKPVGTVPLATSGVFGVTLVMLSIQPYWNVNESDVISWLIVVVAVIVYVPNGMTALSKFGRR